ncbi:LysR family transcriptional regulator [Sphingomonas sp. G-3-2-10]|uniref:LysR family transcriptional regulator n=1 Tax=Sphingomonas sp. G-3-2-10 TaxID=2728838 RepID=UPI00146F35D8|nr:LysR family transcriptional regulator [Sphingomonas sp. G-3-2-10]NML06215.1 LysR family transcriptional regulator [Sphingomonas sp. G-3-2-10]
MRREDLTDLGAFLAVAEERSFTRAAARLGTSQSALSHTIRRLETRLDVRLLMRTTRNVMPTEAGERLLRTLRPAFDDIDAELAALAELRKKPAGRVRITASPDAANLVLWPALAPLLRDHPDLHVEISADSSLTDIVAERFDAGVRLSEKLAKDMIAVRISPDLSMATVGSPDYFARRGVPQTPQDLAGHDCINLRLKTLGGLYAWEYEQDGHEIRVRVEGQLTFNEVPMILSAARAGFGMTHLPDNIVAEDLKAGRLVRVLEPYCRPFSGYHLYYPSRRQLSPAFALIVEALRYRG